MDKLDLDELERLEKAATPDKWDRAELNAALRTLLSSRDCADYATAAIFSGPALIAQAREAERLRHYLSVGLHSVEAVRHVMGDDVPAAGDYSDIPWIKRLREKTGCSLSQAKAAHDLLRLHARAEALEADKKRLREALEEVLGCFDAAYAEGLTQVLAESSDDRLVDLVRRRLEHAVPAAAAALSDTHQPAEAQEDDKHLLCLACGQMVAEYARYFDDGGYCHACNPTDEAWAREVAECRAAEEDTTNGAEAKEAGNG